MNYKGKKLTPEKQQEKLARKYELAEVKKLLEIAENPRNTLRSITYKIKGTDTSFDLDESFAFHIDNSIIRQLNHRRIYLETGVEPDSSPFILFRGRM